MKQPITFGKYLLLERINVGGMAEVFKAKAFGVEGFERILAIKRILPNMADDDEFINMFVDEARIAVQLSHPNIVQIFELGKHDAQYYIAMEYVSGKDLRQFLDRLRKKSQLPPLPIAAFIATKICDGLDYAHRKSDPTGRPLNFIHRDVSPQNILLSYDGDVKITDFGIAKAEDRASRTQAGVLKGKFAYMSPEQVRGMDIDRRSDIYAAGILMYELFTGERLFVGESDFSTLEKVRAGDIPPPRQHNPNIPEELERVMLKALAKDREQRYQWPSELHDDLQQFLIENNTVYTGKRLAEYLSREYAAEISAERQKMEELGKVQAPAPAQAQDGGSESREATQIQPGLDAGEKTIIFDSDFSSARPQPASQSVSGSGGKASISRITPTPVRQVTTRTSVGNRRNVVLIALLCAIGLLGIVAALVTSGGKATIVIFSSPIDQVEVFLDGQAVGTKTPITLNDVAPGQHTLFARADGFAPLQVQTIDVVAGSAPNVYNVTLEPLANATAQVSSKPPGAEVYVDGVLRGKTPLDIGGLDPTRPLVLELRLTGYKTQVVTRSFQRGQTQLAVPVELERDPSAVPSGVLAVTSTPQGATVWLGGRDRGVTPVEVNGLDASGTYSIEVELAGYRRHRATVSFNGGTRVAHHVDLERATGGGGLRTSGRSGAPCQGLGGKLSVIAVGVPNCRVTVGGSDLGVAPLFKKPSPTGQCPVEVSCPDGKVYRQTVSIGSGDYEKVIIRPEDWK